MTDEDRRAVAMVRLRLWGMHPSWLDLLRSTTVDGLEQLADLMEADPRLYEFTKTPRVTRQE